MPSGIGIHSDISEEGSWPIYFLPAIQFDRQYIPRRQLILLRRVAFGRHQYHVDRDRRRDAVANFTVHKSKRLRLRFGDVLIVKDFGNTASISYGSPLKDCGDDTF